MEPKSIAFYTAVAISILAVTSATIFPTLVQIVQAEPTAEENTAAAADNGDNSSQQSAAEPEETDDEATEEDTGDAAEDDDNSDAATGPTNSLRLAESQQAMACGTVVTEPDTEVSLSNDINCGPGDGDGITVLADNVRILLNGHTISSGASDSDLGDSAPNFAGGSGVVVSGAEGVTISGEGEINGFETGVKFIGSNGGGVSGVSLEDNNVGALISNSQNVELSKNTANDNGAGMIAQSSNGVVIILNQIMANEEGILFQNADDGVVVANNILGNEFNGYQADLRSERNRIDYNIAVQNGVDLSNDNLPPDVNQNSYGMHNVCNTSSPEGLCPS
ncbi:MAG TPA: right-handed parallel beta-helix repeat-containing protein [Nitrososphaera sp.]|nr:right-handed parallel beta-helix repeat-containing protein [Nitrososphaera sp.]